MWSILFVHFWDLQPANQLNVYRVLLTNQIFRKYAEIMSRISKRFIKKSSAREPCAIQSSSDEDEEETSFFKDLFADKGRVSPKHIEAKLRVFLIKWMKKWSFEQFLFGGNAFWNETVIIFNYETERKDLRFATFFDVVVKLFVQNVQLHSEPKSELNRRRSRRKPRQKTAKLVESLDEAEPECPKKPNQGSRSKYSFYKIEVDPSLFDKNIDQTYLLKRAKDFLLISPVENKKQRSLIMKRPMYFFDYLYPSFDHEVEYYVEWLFQKEEIPFVCYLGDKEFSFVFKLFVEEDLVTKGSVGFVILGF